MSYVTVLCAIIFYDYFSSVVVYITAAGIAFERDGVERRGVRTD
jgi:hypothetical protein